MDALPVTSVRLRAATRVDPILSKVLRYTKRGWPVHVPEALRPYFQRKQELSVEGECLLWGIRVIIPLKLRSEVLQELHRGHPGIVRMKTTARSHVWWPGMDKELESLSKDCSGCEAVKNAPAVAPLHPWVWPSRPWQRVHLDFAGPFFGRMYLVAIDAHSKWPEVIHMNSTTAAKTIEVLRLLFAAHGLPEQLVSDNGPQFTAEEFALFMANNGVKHILVSPYHPSSNGLAERFVQTFKKAIRAEERKGTPWQQALANFLLTYRSTPHTTTGEAPCMLFLKRPLRTRLDLWTPDCKSRVFEKQAAQKAYHDRHSKQRELSVGQHVSAQNFREGPRWVPGVISERLGPVTYLVKTTHGTVWKRHVDHIRVRSDISVREELPDQDNTESAIFPFEQTPIESPSESQSDSTDSVSDSNRIPDRIEESDSSVNSSPRSRYPSREHRPPNRYM